MNAASHRPPKRALADYLEDLSSLAMDASPLSRQREAELAERIQGGDLAARDELVRANLRFVISVAKRYGRGCLPLSERVSAGNLGLLMAAERFDGTKGLKFITYAVWWIRQSIGRAIASEAHTVRVPRKQLERVRRRPATVPAPGTPDAAAAAEAEAEAVAERVAALAGMTRMVHLDDTFDEDDPASLLDALAGTDQELPDRQLRRESALRALNRALSVLDDREMTILRLYYGLDGCPRATLDQIAEVVGVTRERVRQIKSRAFGKLRHPSRLPVLAELLGEFDEGPEAQEATPVVLSWRPPAPAHRAPHDGWHPHTTPAGAAQVLAPA
jgi:RNA polymerase primary sigma factor